MILYLKLLNSVVITAGVGKLKETVDPARQMSLRTIMRGVPFLFLMAFTGTALETGCGGTSTTPIVNKTSVSISLASSLNPTTYGSSFTLTATVAPATATGAITFLDGSAALGTVSLSSGIAVFSTSALVGGSHSITASYGGDANCAAGTSSAFNQKVTSANSTLVLASSPNPSSFGSVTTFTAAVARPTATGTVTLMDGGQSMGTAPIVNGVAVFAVQTLATGSHSITASYAGDANNSAASAPAITQFVNPAPQVTTTALRNAVPGEPYSALLTANSGTPPYTWSVISGALPLGLSLQASTGTIAGIPTSGTQSSFTVQAMDANSVTATRPLSITSLMSLELAPGNSSLAAGSGQQLVVNGTLSDNSVQDFTGGVGWSSSDSSVATVGNVAGSQGFTMAVSTGTATITASRGSIQAVTLLQVHPASGPNMVYSARTDNCVDGSQPGCVSGKSSGEAGAPLLFRERASDPVPAEFAGVTISAGSCPSGATPLTYPAYCPSPMNSAATDPDFGAYLVMGTDDTTFSPSPSNSYKAAWNLRSNGEWDAFSWDETLLLAENSFGAATILNINPAAIHAQTCAALPGCVNQSGIFSANAGNGDSTHLANGGNWSFSRVPGETHVLYERSGTATQVNKLEINSSIATAGTGTLTRSLYVDFTSDSPVPCGALKSAAPGNPTTYSASWAGSFQVADDGSVSYGMTGAYDWAPSWTVTPVDTFILPTIGNPGGFGFQATAATGSGATGTSAPTWCQTAGCTVTDASSSGLVTWTNIDKLTGQGAGFDLVIYRPPGTSAPGCTRINSRLGKIYRGTGNGAPAGYMTTTDQVACTRAGTFPSSCLMPDRFTLHEAGQVMNGQYVEFSPTEGGNPNSQGKWNSGTLSCQASNTTWEGAYTAANSYNSHDIVSFAGFFYAALKAVPSGGGHAPSGTISANVYWTNAESFCSSYIFDTATTTVAPVTDWVWGTGHAASGYLHKYQGALYRSMFYGSSCPNCPALNGRLNPGTPLLLSRLPCDDHGTYRNAGTDDLTPVFALTTDVPAWASRYAAACYDEVCAFNPDGSGLTYRLGHTYNTGSSSYFQTQNSIGVSSPLGDLAAFATDMMGTRGSNANANTACNNLRGQYRPAASGTVTYGDYVFPTVNNNNSNIFRATDCGADTPGATCTEAASPPNWDGACPLSCTDGGVTWTNAGPNNCRGDIVIMDASRAHAAP